MHSNKKRKLFHYNDKIYRVERVNRNNDKTYYNCYNCGVGRINSFTDGDGGEIIVETKACCETCDSSPEQQLALSAKQELIQRYAEDINETPLSCYETACRNLERTCPAALQHFPSFTSMRTNLKRARLSTLPAIPTTYESIPSWPHFPVVFQQNYSGVEQFLFLDLDYVSEGPVIAEPKRILGFMCNNSAKK